MAIDSRGPDGRPQFLGTGAPATADDLTTLGKEIYERGTRLIGTTAQRDAYPYKVEGLEWWNTTTNSGEVYVDGSWIPLLTYSPWVTVSALNNWTAGTGGNAPQMRHGFGKLQFRGSLYGGTGYTNATTVPAGFPLPSRNTRVPIVTDGQVFGVAVLFPSGPTVQFSANTHQQSFAEWPLG